jgi:inhibitor of KinA sporulation pathway (predicted exonuclease)
MVRTYGAEYPTIAPLLQDLLEGEIVLAYNSPFDMRLLAQTAMAHRLDCTWLEGVRWYDVQQLANAYYGKRIGLQKFMETYGIVGNGKHRAVEDCQDTLAVLKYIAEQRTSYEVNANE